MYRPISAIRTSSKKRLIYGELRVLTSTDWFCPIDHGQCPLLYA